jgi:hypothetical protein
VPVQDRAAPLDRDRLARRLGVELGPEAAPN